MPISVEPAKKSTFAIVPSLSVEPSVNVAVRPDVVNVKFATGGVFDAGTAEVHMRISSPPVVGPCFYGIDLPDEGDLIAASRSVEEVIVDGSLLGVFDEPDYAGEMLPGTPGTR